MKGFLLTIFAIINVVIVYGQSPIWSRANVASVKESALKGRAMPQKFEIFQLNQTAMAARLKQAPSEKSLSADTSGLRIELPDVNGKLQTFIIVSAPVAAPALLRRLNGAQSFSGKSMTDPHTIVRFSISKHGLNAIISTPGKPAVYIRSIDPNSGMHIVFTDEGASGSTFECTTTAKAANLLKSQSQISIAALKNANTGNIRVFRLALAASGEFGDEYDADNANSGSDSVRINDVLTYQLIWVTDANLYLERDFGIRLQVIADNHKIIYLNGSNDPFHTNLNSETQTEIDAKIGTDNYDIGHLMNLTSGSNNGNAGDIGSICKASTKGSAFTSRSDWTAFNGYAAIMFTHELGHQCGANHTFTHQEDNDNAQVEPGSGSTIMSYGGNGNAPSQYVIGLREKYFHTISIIQVTNYIASVSCGSSVAKANTAPSVNAGKDYTIPKSTSFTLKGNASDADGDAMTFTWEQLDKLTSTSDFPWTLDATNTKGPAFRSRAPSSSMDRTLPMDGHSDPWEVLPSVGRTINFRLTARDGKGGVGFGDMEVDVSSFSGPFAVTTGNVPVTWAANSCQLIKWDVANTDSWLTVNCKQVKISLSTDGGQTFPTVLLASTDNDGEESIQIPTVSSSTCRIKVEAVGNIFFDINNADITVSGTSNLSFSVNTTGVTGCGKADGKALFSVSGAPAGAVYEYSVDGNFSNSPSFENLAMGSHSAILRDKNTKCELTQNFVIGGFTTLNIQLSGTGFRTFCAFESATATLTATASGGSGSYTYSWPGGVKTVSSSGWHSVTVTDVVTGCTKTAGGFVVFVPVICSFDPNDIIGPVGYSTGKMVSKFDQWPYMIRFENDPDFATAPAQVVKITNPLDSNLNPLSFRLGSFGFGGFTFSVPENKTYYSTRLNLMDSLGVVVDVTAGIDVTKREAFWIFEAKDPATGLPPADAIRGFLPVNDTITRKGEGFVNYTIKPANHTATGDSVHAAASIVFDINAPIATPKIFNTIDAEKPVSRVRPMPATSDTNVFVLSWSGQDEVGGSGVRFYDLYVSENGGAYTAYQTGIADTSTAFTGLYGVTYDFFTRAADNTGNKEAVKTTSEQRVIVRSILSRPDLGADTTVYKCPGDFVNLNSLFNLSNLYAVWNTSTDTAQIMPGVFTLIANNSNGLKDTAVVTILNRQKPDLGNDTTIGYCLGSYVNLRNVINTTTYATALWNAVNPDSVGAGAYTLVVSSVEGCRDTVVITVAERDSATWTGAIDNDYNVAGNWNTNCVPTAAMTAIIPSGNPTIKGGTVAIRNVIVEAGAMLNLNDGAVLNLTGDFTNNGTIASEGTSSNGKIKFIGTNVQNIGGGGLYSHVEIGHNTEVTVLSDLIVKTMNVLLGAKLTVPSSKTVTVLQ